MKTYIKIITLSLSSVCLSACMTDNFNNASHYYDSNMPQQNQLYPEGYDSIQTERVEMIQPESSHNVIVPETYHVSANMSPESSKDMDRKWVDSQNPQSYTIELANSDKASVVANALYKTPKTEHSAEVTYQSRGKEYYKGLYGTYSSYDAAQEKLNSLPEDVKQGASIKTWGAVQNQ